MEIVIIAILMVVIIALSAAMLYREFSHLHDENKTLHDENKTILVENSTLKARIKMLEEANRKRMPYEAYDAILDALAGLDVEERESQFHTSIRENIRGHLFKAVSIGTKREGKNE